MENMDLWSIAIIALGLVILILVFVAFSYYKTQNEARKFILKRCYTDWTCKDTGGTPYSPVSDLMGRLYSCRTDNFTLVTKLEGTEEVKDVCVCPIKWVGKDEKTSYLTCDNTHNGNPTGQGNISTTTPEGYGYKSCDVYTMEYSGQHLLNPDGTLNILAADAGGTNPCETLWNQVWGETHDDKPPVYTWDLYSQKKAQNQIAA